MLRLFGKKKKQKKEEEINFQKNGSLLLEELIATSGGIYNPIRTFSSHQILQATNHFDWNYLISEDRYVWYRGMIENRLVLIKKFQDCSVFDADNFYRDIAVSSMMSSHKNVLKLLGCCLEFSRPVLVCEYPENGALNCIRRGNEGVRPFPWNVRLRIAKEIANAVAYLHTEFPRTIVHRNLKLANIFLDKNWSAKLSSFSLSILIPEGELGVNDMVCRTSSYIEPEYFNTGLVTENVDIYSLGIIMLVLLTGKSEYTSEVAVYLPVLPVYVGKYLERGLLTELIDPSMLDRVSNNIPEHSRLQMEAFIELAFRCVRFRPGENVPRMVDVAKELEMIEKHI
ncbi:Serine/threonine-protein kinase ZRK7 [Cardamine amara subsp. amara]|uniref:Serine/threonine-protein kinase ZRK7 n=1 Tax=Cardamine amara subsp. amara TaxID=228776 RepID=A0ABD0ZIS2_CARAN